MKRWFLSRMVFNDETQATEPAVARHSPDYRVWANLSATLCVGQVAFRNVGPLQADPDIHLFPDQMLLDFRWDSIGSQARSALLAGAQSLGFTTSGIGPNASNRDVLHSFVHQMAPGANIEAGDLRDPWG